MPQIQHLCKEMTFLKNIGVKLIGIFLLSACAIHGPFSINNHIGLSDTIVQTVMSRNTTIEDDPAWILRAQRQLMIRKLSGIQHLSNSLATHLYCGGIFIFVHPGYHVFVETQSRTTPDTLPTENLVEKFIRTPTRVSGKSALMKSYEAEIRNAIELLSTAGYIIVLVIPPEGKDKDKIVAWQEYRRYLNEITNGSEYVYYLESRDLQTGKLTGQGYKALIHLTEALEVEKLYIGGQYYGRCLYTFYKGLPKTLRKKVRFVARWSAPDPEDITIEEAIALRGKDGWIDEERAYELLSHRRINRIRGGRKVLRLKELCN